MTADNRRPGCPPWCTASHDLSFTSCTSDGHWVRLPGVVQASVWAARWCGRATVEHLSVLAGPGNRLHLGEPRGAKALAALLDALADASPEQHRELADAIRREAGLLGWEEAPNGQ